MNIDLKPCPFCHERRLSLGETSGGDSMGGGCWFVTCQQCTARGPVEEKKFEALASWENRTRETTDDE